MNQLHKALHALGLEPGAPFDAIKRRYKHLVMVWHPDRMPTPEGRAEAEEELKKINHSFDVLKTHFATGHRANASCGCEPNAEARTDSTRSSKGAYSGHNSTDRYGASNSQKSQPQERDFNRENESCQFNAEDVERRAHSRRQSAASMSSRERNDEKLRWQVAQSLSGGLLILLATCWVGCVTRDACDKLQSGLVELCQAPKMGHRRLN